MINTVKRVESEYGTTVESDAKAFKTLYDAEECGYNRYIVMQGKTLRSICMNDNTFEQDFAEYLKAFDDVLKQLLGIERENFALHINGAEVYAFHLVADGEQVQRLRKGNKAAVTVCAEANALPTGDQLHYGFHFIERNYVLWRDVRGFKYLVRERAQAAAAAAEEKALVFKQLQAYPRVAFVRSGGQGIGRGYRVVNARHE